MIILQGENITYQEVEKKAIDKDLIIKDTKLEYLPNLVNLQSLRCINSPIKNIPHMSELVILNLSCSLVVQIPYFPKLQELYISSTKIESIDKRYQNQLIILEISESSFKINKEDIWLKLETLHADNCNITNITNLIFPNLMYLNCSFNPINKIVNMKFLKELIADHCHLIELDNLPNITNISVCNNKLTKIPLLKNVKFLDCSKNSIIDIQMSDTIIKLYASYNLLKSIELSPSLKELDISFNMISNIPKNNIHELIIHMNPINNIILFSNIKLLTINLYQYHQIIDDRLNNKIQSIQTIFVWEIMKRLQRNINYDSNRDYFKEEITPFNYVEKIKHKFPQNWKNICKSYTMALCLELKFK